MSLICNNWNNQLLNTNNSNVMGISSRISPVCVSVFQETSEQVQVTLCIIGEREGQRKELPFTLAEGETNPRILGFENGIASTEFHVQAVPKVRKTTFGSYKRCTFHFEAIITSNTIRTLVSNDVFYITSSPNTAPFPFTPSAKKPSKVAQPSVVSPISLPISFTQVVRPPPTIQEAMSPTPTTSFTIAFAPTYSPFIGPTISDMISSPISPSSSFDHASSAPYPIPTQLTSPYGTPSSFTPSSSSSPFSTPSMSSYSPSSSPFTPSSVNAFSPSSSPFTPPFQSSFPSTLTSADEDVFAFSPPASYLTPSSFPFTSSSMDASSLSPPQQLFTPDGPCDLEFDLLFSYSSPSVSPSISRFK